MNELIALAAAAPALVYLRSRRGPLDQMIWTIQRVQVVGVFLKLIAVDVIRDRGYYWRRALTELGL